MEGLAGAQGDRGLPDREGIVGPHLPSLISATATLWRRSGSAEQSPTSRPHWQRRWGRLGRRLRPPGRMLRERFLARHAWAAPALAGTEGIGLGLDARRVAE